ncbi:hypothetical protein [Streptomyces sp. NPDC050263]|uniref:hypothetical protein n=1 Tax=Streptomyces sp. NPDC050263 TaxID=3155037 RepID=UPI003447E24B
MTKDIEAPPFLHGSARNQAYRAEVAEHSSISPDDLPKLPHKEVSASTWLWGTGETIAVIAVMIVGCRLSGTIARRRTAAATAAPENSPADLIQA